MTVRELRRRPGHRVLSVALALTIALSNVGAAAGQRRTDAARTDGEALFRAVFLLEGPLAGEIPQLERLRSMRTSRRLTPRQQRAVQAFETRLIQELRAAKPTFFQSFERDLKTGDRVVISRAIAEASRLARDVMRKGDPAVARFLSRHEASLARAVKSAASSAGKSGPPDVRALQRAIPPAASRDAEKLELAWLKGFEIGPSASEPQQPDTDHNIAVILLTFIAVVVLALVALPIVAPGGDDDLYHEQLVSSLAVRLGGR